MNFFNFEMSLLRLVNPVDRMVDNVRTGIESTQVSPFPPASGVFIDNKFSPNIFLLEIPLCPFLRKYG